MAVTAVFVLFFGAWVGFEKEANILANFASTGPFFLLAAMVIGQIFTKVGLGRRISLYVLPMFGNKAKAVLLAVMMGTCVVSMFLADIPTALVFFGLCAPILEQNGCEPGKSKFGKAIMLGIPVGAAIGGIGTPATRADTIEKLVRSKLVERKGRQLHATTEGERLTDVVEPRLKDVLLTARMEQALSDVEHGKRGPSEVMDMFHREALRIPADATANLKAAAVTRTANTDAQEWGDCPRCGQPVRKTGRMWQCSTNKTEKTKDGKWATTAGCGWKMFARIAGKTITDQTARRLLAGQSVTLKGFTSKSGKKFDAAIRIDKERGTAFDFDR